MASPRGGRTQVASDFRSNATSANRSFFTPSSEVECSGFVSGASDSTERRRGTMASSSLPLTSSSSSTSSSSTSSSRRFEQEAIQLVRAFLEKLERRQQCPNGESRSGLIASSAFEQDGEFPVSGSRRAPPPSGECHPDVASALQQLIGDLQGLCTETEALPDMAAREDKSDSTSTAIRPSPHIVLTQLLSSRTPLANFEQRRLLSAATFANASADQALHGAARDRPGCRELLTTNDDSSTSTVAVSSSGSRPAIPAFASTSSDADNSRRRGGGGRTESRLEGGGCASKRSALNRQGTGSRLSGVESSSVADLKLRTSHNASLRAKTLTAAEAVALCGQELMKCSARYVPKVKRDFVSRRSAVVASLSATTRSASPVLSPSSGKMSLKTDVFYDGAHLPQFDDCDEYRDDSDVGFRVLDISEEDYFKAYCGSPLKEHPLVCIHETPAVDLHSAQLALAGSVANSASFENDNFGGDDATRRVVATPLRRGGVSNEMTSSELSPFASIRVSEAEDGNGRSRSLSRAPSPSFGSTSDAACGEAKPRFLDGSPSSSFDSQSQHPENTSLDVRCRLPTFGTGDEQAALLVEEVSGGQTTACDDTEAENAPSGGVTQSDTVSEKEGFRAVSAEDELADCSVQVKPQQTAASEGQDYELLHKHNMERAAYEAARLWNETYCEGNATLFRKRQAVLAAETLQHATYPPSGDKFYPVESADGKYDCFNLKVVFNRNRTGASDYAGFALPPGTLVGGRYRVEFEIGSAAFCCCLQALDVTTGERVCLKVVINEKAYVDQSMDEVSVLRLLQANGDPDKYNFIRLKDFMYFLGNLVIVTELLDEDLYAFNCEIKRQRQLPFWTLGRIQRVMKDILLSLRFVHGLHIIHGDLKPENILCCFTNQVWRAQQDSRNPHEKPSPRNACSKADDSEPVPSTVFSQDMLSKFGVKVIDFGNSCFTSDELSLYMQSRSYRAPEIFLGLPYDTKIDIWSLGCIAYELWTGDTLLECNTAAALLAKLTGILGPLPFYMVRCSPLKHTLFDPEGFLYEFSDSCTKQQQEQHPSGPSVGLYREDNENTLLNAIERYISEQESIANPSSAGAANQRKHISERNRPSRMIRFFVPKKTSLYQRMRCLDPVFVEFVSKMLQFDPCKRWSADMLLTHPFLEPGRYPDGL